MDPRFRSSFIPKKQVAQESPARKKSKRPSSINLFALASSLLFIVSVVAAGGMFGYTYILEERINQKGIELSEGRALLDLDQIDDYKLLDQRLETAWNLLRNHKTTSKLFGLLETNTLHNVQFNEYEFELTVEDELIATLKGEAATFNALALQVDVFDRQSLFSSVAYSDIHVTNTGTVGFTMTSIFDPNEVLYTQSFSE